jgi:hypothetical protein
MDLMLDEFACNIFSRSPEQVKLVDYHHAYDGAEEHRHANKNSYQQDFDRTFHRILSPSMRSVGNPYSSELY